MRQQHPLPLSLQEGEVWVEYHPASGKTARLLRDEGHSHPSPSVSHPSKLFDPQNPPWSPFRTRQDFEQAELFLRFNCTDSHINQQLKLIRDGSTSVPHKITLQSAKEIHALLARVPKVEMLSGVRILLSLSSPELTFASVSSSKPRNST